MTRVNSFGLTIVITPLTMPLTTGGYILRSNISPKVKDVIKNFKGNKKGDSTFIT